MAQQSGQIAGSSQFLTEQDLPERNIAQERPIATPRIGLAPSTESARPLELLHNTLMINGVPFGSVTVRAGEEASVAWSLPDGRDAEGIYLRVSDREFDTPCSNDVGSFADYANPDSGYKPGAPTGALALMLGNPAYRIGGTYYLKGCLWRAGEGYTGDETNTVALTYDALPFLAQDFLPPEDVNVGIPPPLPGETGAALATATPLPDLSIALVTPIASGPDRGRLQIWITATSGLPGQPPPAGTYRYRVADWPEHWVRRRDSQEYNESLLEPYYRGLYRMTETGTAQVRKMFVGYGDVITTEYRLTDLDTLHRIAIQINYNPSEENPTIPARPGEGGVDLRHGRREYHESNYWNNQRMIDVGRWSGSGTYMDVTDATVVDEGSDWLLLRLTYSYLPREEPRTGRFELRPSLQVEAFDSAGKDDFPGRWHFWGRESHLNCWGAGGNPRISILDGMNRRVRFYCSRMWGGGPRPRPGTRPSLSTEQFRAIVEFPTGHSGRYRRSWGFRIRKEWSFESETRPPLPDLEPFFTGSPEQRPRLIQVGVKNDAMEDCAWRTLAMQPYTKKIFSSPDCGRARFTSPT
jgi:hypothetical protein